MPLHPRNPHRGRYDFATLCKSLPNLRGHLKDNPTGDKTIDFSDNNAVLCLNQALLAHYYQVTHWQIPSGYLCPPIPGRADYIHYAADLLAGNGQDASSVTKNAGVLDIGTGASCIYAIIGSQSYQWNFVASDIDPASLKSARSLIESNPCLADKVILKQQPDRTAIFQGVIEKMDRFDLTLCNPPFHASMEEVRATARLKWKKLGGRPKGEEKQNFGGQETELCCLGGELGFLKRMIRESVDFAEQVLWFTSLVSRNDNVRPLKRLLVQLGAKRFEVVKMSQGQKMTRFIAWSFQTKNSFK